MYSDHCQGSFNIYRPHLHSPQCLFINTKNSVIVFWYSVCASSRCCWLYMHTAPGFKEQNTTGGSTENILGGKAGLKTLHKSTLICVAWLDWFDRGPPSVPSSFHSLSLSPYFCHPSHSPIPDGPRHYWWHGCGDRRQVHWHDHFDQD